MNGTDQNNTAIVSSNEAKQNHDYGEIFPLKDIER